MMTRTVAETMVADRRSALARAADVHRLRTRAAAAVVRTSAAAVPVRAPGPTTAPCPPLVHCRRPTVLWG